MDTSTTTESVDGLAQNLRQKVDDAERLLKQAAAAGDRTLDESRGRLESQLRRLREDLDDLQDATLRGARRALRNADNVVHDHPYGAMGVGAAIGLLIGLLVTRRW
ncbi:MAG TPA: DUF883 domain-containing protein [Burkholderiaceae bacterium]|nr:DUF883 domain-containing protein [Burkholderiaceae bacterium]